MINKTEAREKIENFFLNIKDKKPDEIKKIKKLASHHHIRLNEKKKLFCKYCFSAKLKTRKISKNQKTVECENCGRLMRWKIS